MIHFSHPLASKWELFDRQTFAIIEAAYNNDEASVLLTHGMGPFVLWLTRLGFFGKAADGYTIDFRTMEQTNNSTNYKRKVRRVEGNVSQRVVATPTTHSSTPKSHVSSTCMLAYVMVPFSSS